MALSVIQRNRLDAFVHNRGKLLWTVFAGSLLIVLTLLFVLPPQKALSVAEVSATATPTHKPAQATSAVPPTSVVQAADVHVTSSVASNVPGCIAASYSLPSQLDLSGSSNGLTAVTDAPTLYQVYGNTTAQIRAQMAQCAPHSDGSSEFAADTSYTMSWQYTWYQNASGSCSVSDAKVGMHINSVLPQWQAVANTPSGLASTWQTFLTNLTTHEHGHAALDEQYAQQTLSDLQSFTASDCASLTSSVQTKMQADLAALNAANDAYDAQTNHGATQGAILLP